MSLKNLPILSFYHILNHEFTAPKPKGWTFRPPRLPVIAPGKIVVLQDKDGSWWFVCRRQGRGLLTLNDFGKGRSGKDAAETWAASERIRLKQ